MIDEARLNGLLIECIVCGLAESCQNIRLSRLMKQVLCNLYDSFREDEVHALCLSAFHREGKHRLRQDAFLSQPQPSMMGREEFACTAGWSNHQRALDEMVACCCAIWLKEEGRELGTIECLGDFIYLPRKKPSPPTTGALRERRSQVLASILHDPLAGWSPPSRLTAPARLTDIPFVHNAADIASFITRAFKGRN